METLRVFLITIITHHWRTNYIFYPSASYLQSFVNYIKIDCNHFTAWVAPSLDFRKQYHTVFCDVFIRGTRIFHRTIISSTIILIADPTISKQCIEWYLVFICIFPNDFFMHIWAFPFHTVHLTMQWSSPYMKTDFGESKDIASHIRTLKISRKSSSPKFSKKRKGG